MARIFRATDVAQQPPVVVGGCWRVLRIAIGLILAFQAHASPTLEREAAGRLSVHDFQRATFGEKEGAPERTWAIAQTNDGWLWFGGSTGLTRFDGIQFEKVDVSTPDGRLSSTVSTLYALPSGGLVIGHMSGGVTILDRGVARRFSSDVIRAKGRPYDFVADAEGALWASFEGGLMRFDGQDWSVVGAEWNLAAGPVRELYADIDGVLWAHGRHTLWRLMPGTARFEAVATLPEPAAVLVSPEGRFWYTTDKGMVCLCESGLVGKPRPTEASRRSSTYYFDRSGTFWSPDPPSFRRPPLAVEGIDSIGFISVTIQDVDGNVWLAEAAGKVHRLRRTAITRISLPQKSSAHAAMLLPSSLAVGRAGEIWMSRIQELGASQRFGIWRIENDQLLVWDEGDASAGNIASDGAGNVWWIVRLGLWEWDGARSRKRADLPATVGAEQVGSMAAGCAGGVWVAVRGAGLLRFDGDSWRTGSDLARLPSAAPTSLACDAADHLWLGYGDGRVLRLSANAEITSFEFDGGNVGTVSAISSGKQVVVGGELGVAVLQRGRFARVDTRLPILQGATGIVESAGGDVWLYATRGLVLLASAALVDAAKAPDVTPARLFDAADGFPGPAFSSAFASRAVARDSGGRIWIAGLGGLAHLDPSATKPGSAPRLVLKSLTADGREFALFDPPSLPKGTRNLEISYTALNATHPDRLRFRYRMEDIDGDWVDVGSRRQATYTNLSPGLHRFSLDVTDELGMWTNRPAMLTFEIPPTFVQSSAFKLMCIVAALGLLVVAYRLRIGQLERRHRVLLAERLDERSRIARELHDTLLQGTQALILKVHSATALSRKGEPNHEELSKALDQATDAVVQARNGIEDLRGRSETDRDLAASLIAFTEELMKEQTAQVKVMVEGTARKLAPKVQREAYLIGREALLNAFYHSKASAIELQVVFSDDGLAVRVRDDGVGFDESVLTRPASGRHWGLPGMQERARAVPAALQIWSKPGAGTEVELRVVAAVAYPRVITFARWPWSKRLNLQKE